MKELLEIENGCNCTTNQVLYNLENREIEFDLLPWSQKNNIPILPYSPIGNDRGLLKNPVIAKIARRRDAAAAQIAPAWLLHQPGVIAIPKASNEEHVRANAR